MSTKPNCANCGRSYERDHKWSGKGRGACKSPRPGVKQSVYSEPSIPSSEPGKVGA